MAVSDAEVSTLFTSTIEFGSEEDVKVFCQPCDRNGLTHPAFGYCTDCEDHLCQSCYSSHRHIKPCRNHILHNRDSMPNSLRQSANPSIMDHSEVLTRPCPQHNTKTIEFYCHDHKVILCSVCVTLEHTRSLCKVDYIPDISEHTANSKEYTNTIQKMDALLNQCHTIKTETKRATDTSNSSLSNALKEMKKYHEEIKKMFDDMEREVEDKIRALKTENDSRQRRKEACCDNTLKPMKVLYDTIKELNTSEQEEKLFLELKIAQEVLPYNESCMNDLSKMTNIIEYEFESNQTIACFLENEKSLGLLTPKQDKHSLGMLASKHETSLALAKQTSKKLKATSSSFFQPSRQGAIKVKMPNDKNPCHITGMTLLTPDQLVLADNDNNRVKIVNIKSKQIISQLTLSSSPKDITSVSSTELAVTKPDKKTIQFISVTSNKLHKTHKLRVDGECRGISCYKLKLVVTYGNPNKLEVLDLKGTVLTSVSTDSSGNCIFLSPDHVTVNSKSIYVSNLESVIRLNWKGEVTGRYTDLKVAGGLTLTKKGTMYVCDQNGHNIQEISDKCTNGRVIMMKLMYPMAVCWCDVNNMLYISSSWDVEAWSNYITMIKMP